MHLRRALHAKLRRAASVTIGLATDRTSDVPAALVAAMNEPGLSRLAIDDSLKDDMSITLDLDTGDLERVSAVAGSYWNLLGESLDVSPRAAAKALAELGSSRSTVIWPDDSSHPSFTLTPAGSDDREMVVQGALSDAQRADIAAGWSEGAP